MIPNNAILDVGGYKKKRLEKRISLTYLLNYFQRFMIVSGKRGSNPRPPAWEASALPTELLPR